MTTQTTSYADVLHRLALGEEITGAELLALPGEFPNLTPIEPQLPYVLGDLPELIAHVLTIAALLEDEDGQQALDLACEIIGHLRSDALYGKPAPEQVRVLLWDIATRVDLAQKLSEV